MHIECDWLLLSAHFLRMHNLLGHHSGAFAVVSQGQAARLPRACPMALGYRLPPCNDDKGRLLLPDEAEQVGIIGGAWAAGNSA